MIDDFGLAALSETQKQDLLEAIEERHGSDMQQVAMDLATITGQREGGLRRLAGY